MADKEIVPGRLIAGFNLLYAPERTRLHSNAETKQESTLGFAAAITARVQPGLFLGGEARYLRHYDGLGLDRLAGDALYLGPTLYARLGGTWWLSATWNSQVAGRAGSAGGALDLANFERHQARLRLGVDF